MQTVGCAVLKCGNVVNAKVDEIWITPVLRSRGKIARHRAPKCAKNERKLASVTMPVFVVSSIRQGPVCRQNKVRGD